MNLALVIIVGVIVVLGGFALWIKTALWLNGLPVDEDGKRDYPWSDE